MFSTFLFIYLFKKKKDRISSGKETLSYFQVSYPSSL